MKTTKLLYLCICTISTAQASPIYFSKFDAFCAHVARSQTFCAVRKVGYWGAIGCVIYAATRYLNDLRNSSQISHVTFTPSARAPFSPKLIIQTSGAIIIRGDPLVQEPIIEHELINPETSKERSSAQPMTIWKRLWKWLIAPSHQGFVLLRNSVPRNTHLKLTLKHNYDFDTRFMRTAYIDGIIGNIEATADTGDFYINEPKGRVEAGTEGTVEINNFSGDLFISKYGSLSASRKNPALPGNTPKVTVYGHELPLQQEYRLTGPVMPVY